MTASRKASIGASYNCIKLHVHDWESYLKGTLLHGQLVGPWNGMVRLTPSNTDGCCLKIVQCASVYCAKNCVRNGVCHRRWICSGGTPSLCDPSYHRMLYEPYGFISSGGFMLQIDPAYHAPSM